MCSVRFAYCHADSHLRGASFYSSLHPVLARPSSPPIAEEKLFAKLPAFARRHISRDKMRTALRKSSRYFQCFEHHLPIDRSCPRTARSTRHPPVDLIRGCRLNCPLNHSTRGQHLTRQYPRSYRALRHGFHIFSESSGTSNPSCRARITLRQEGQRVLPLLHVPLPQRTAQRLIRSLDRQNVKSAKPRRRDPSGQNFS